MVALSARDARVRIWATAPADDEEVVLVADPHEVTGHAVAALAPQREHVADGLDLDDRQLTARSSFAGLSRKARTAV